MNDDGMDFKEALNYVVESKKDVIFKTIVEKADDSDDESDEDNEDEKYPCKNVWTILLEESLAEEADMLKGLKQYIQSLQKDEVYQVVMTILKIAMENKDMNIDDVLDCAVEKEK